MHKSLILFVLIFIAISCNNDNEGSNKSESAIDLVTGLDLRSSINGPVVRLGNPNTFTGINTGLLVFPNPPIDFLFVSSNTAISNIWFVIAEGEKKFQEVDFPSILNSGTYDEDSIQNQSVLTLNDLDSETIPIDVSPLGTGYYRIFIKTQNAIYWENIFVADQEFNFENFVEFWN